MDMQPIEVSLTEQISAWIAGLNRQSLPKPAQHTANRLVLDVFGLCIAARNEDYIRAVVGTTDAGNATALGHQGSFTAYDAALINGTAAHGEDFDDTFEGGPVHSGAVIVPAILALSERESISAERALLGIAVGTELTCRLCLVAPKAIHAAGFHPTAVLGALGAAAATATALGLTAAQTMNAIGIAGSTASGIIEYLAEGTWTKRMHAGWAAQAGMRAALMARGGFTGPRTVLEGTHGFFKAFAPSRKPDFAPVLNGLGKNWVIEDIAFKPYACGTMTQPYIDCAIKLAERGVDPAQITDIVCDVGEGTVHRLWDPLKTKQNPPTPYAAKFSTPFCMAVGFFDRRAGFNQFTEAKIHDPAIIALTNKIRYNIDPANPYPAKFTGHLRATLANGEIIEIAQDHMRGGAQAPLPDDELTRKFLDNCIYGGWSPEQAEQARQWCETAFDSTGFSGLTIFRN